VNENFATTQKPRQLFALMHKYDVRPARDGGADLISEMLPWGKLRYGGENATQNAIGYARFYSKAHETEVTVFDGDGNVIAVHRWDPTTGTDLVI
jgi:hypothetical protein